MWYIIGAIGALVIIVVILAFVLTPTSTGFRRSGYLPGTRDPRADDKRLSRYTRPDGSEDYYPASWHGPDEPGGSFDL